MVQALFRITRLSTILKFVTEIPLFGFAQLRVDFIASVFVLRLVSLRIKFFRLLFVKISCFQQIFDVWNNPGKWSSEVADYSGDLS